MSNRDSGCSIFCCFRRPKTRSPAKVALEEDPPFNPKDVEPTHGANSIETEANNLTFDKNKEFPERNEENVHGASVGSASTEAQQKGGTTDEAITEAPSSQNEPPPPECVNLVKLTSSLGVENAENGGVGSGELDIGDVTVKVGAAQLDANEEQLACLEQLVERLEAVADALEATSGPAGLNDAIVSGRHFLSKWVENKKISNVLCGVNSGMTRGTERGNRPWVQHNSGCAQLAFSGK